MRGDLNKNLTFSPEITVTNLWCSGSFPAGGVIRKDEYCNYKR